MSQVRSSFRAFFIGLFCLFFFGSTPAFPENQDLIDLKSYPGMTVEEFKNSLVSEPGFSLRMRTPIHHSYATFELLFRSLFNPVEEKSSWISGLNFLKKVSREKRESLVRDYARIAAFLENPNQVYFCLKYLNEKLIDRISTESKDRREMLSWIDEFAHESVTLQVKQGIRTFEIGNPERYQNVRFQKMLTQILADIEADVGIHLVDPANQSKKVWFSKDDQLFDRFIKRGQFIKDIGAGREHGFYTHQLQWACVFLGKKLDLDYVNALENHPAVLYRASVKDSWKIEMVTERFLLLNPQFRGADWKGSTTWMPIHPFVFVADAAFVQNDLDGSVIRIREPIWVRNKKGTYLISDRASLIDFIRESLGIPKEESIELASDLDLQNLFYASSGRNPFWFTDFLITNNQKLNALSLKMATYFVKPQFRNVNGPDAILEVYRNKYSCTQDVDCIERRVPSGKVQ